MGTGTSLIETGVDKLVSLVNAKEKITTAEAAKELGLSTTMVMEWAEFLEEEGIINIKYKLTKTFLEARKLQKKEVTKKAKEFSGRKDIFVRKAEVSLGFLEKEAEKLSGIKKEFDKIKDDLGLDMGSIQNELEALEKYEGLKIELDKQIEEQKQSSVEKIQEMSQEIAREKQRYSEILDAISEEEKKLKKDQADIEDLKGTEKDIREKLDTLQDTIDSIDKKIKGEEEQAEAHEKNLRRLNDLAEDIKAHVAKEAQSLEPLLEKSKEQEQRIKELQETIVAKVAENQKKIQGAKQASKKMKSFFEKKMGVIGLIEKVNKDRNDLKNELMDLIKKAKAFQISAKSADLDAEIRDLQKKFEEVDKKKWLFEKELRKLSSFFR